ncbi:MAG: MBL fold metallo-hydrolase [Nitrospirae bacterium]|nr:MBL fold metallo-hydrolase [Nitrospirota bacterium]
MKNLNSPPDEDEIEISIFGPGYGESIVIHIGENNWIIVDSCIDAKTKRPVPLQYLEQIGVDPKTSVKLVVATHWHDDHIRGLSEIMNNCGSAVLSCSIAINTVDFYKLLFLLSNNSMMKNTGLDEFINIKEILQKRNPIWAIENKLLWKMDLRKSDQQCEVSSLSPSDLPFTYALTDFSKLIPKDKENKRYIPAITPNRASVVLWIKIGDFYVLLGADLQEEGNAKTGWSAIVTSTLRPTCKATFYKIPYHGSKNAHHIGVWTEMLDKNPISVLTPFSRGDTKLPTGTDIQRIRNLTENAYSTALPMQIKKTKRSHAVEKTINETVKKIEQNIISTGHVRLRKKSAMDIKVELFNDAVFLTNLVAIVLFMLVATFVVTTFTGDNQGLSGQPKHHAAATAAEKALASIFKRQIDSA